MEKNYRKFIGVYTLVVIALTLLAVGKCSNACSGERIVRDTVLTEKWDTITREIRDTVPAVRYVRVVEKIPNPFVVRDTITQDSLPIVQKEYSDDSTYTAYVSGIGYEDWPKLDSIITRQRDVTHTIERVITRTEKEKKRLRLKIGLQAGYGYGFKSKQIEPYVGIGGTITW